MQKGGFDPNFIRNQVFRFYVIQSRCGGHGASKICAWLITIGNGAISIGARYNLVAQANTPGKTMIRVGSVQKGSLLTCLNVVCATIKAAFIVGKATGCNEIQLFGDIGNCVDVQACGQVLLRKLVSQPIWWCGRQGVAEACVTAINFIIGLINAYGQMENFARFMRRCMSCDCAMDVSFQR